jgi:fumarate reductase subunit D
MPWIAIEAIATAILAAVAILVSLIVPTLWGLRRMDDRVKQADVDIKQSKEQLTTLQTKLDTWTFFAVMATIGVVGGFFVSQALEEYSEPKRRRRWWR